MDLSKPNRKYIFQTLKEAMSALRSDRLGTVYIKANTVFICTAWGTGTFDKKEWDKINE